MPHDWPEPLPPGIDFGKEWKPKPGSFIGPMLSLPDGMIFTPAPVPFAYEIESDGQKVRLEAPTAQGLLVLMEANGMIDVDAVPQVVQGQPPPC